MMIIVLVLRGHFVIVSNESLCVIWLIWYDDYCASLNASYGQICDQYCVSFKGPIIPCIIRDSEITDSYDMMTVVLDLRDLLLIVFQKSTCLLTLAIQKLLC